jgi:hypothetical protein
MNNQEQTKKIKTTTLKKTNTQEELNAFDNIINIDTDVNNTNKNNNVVYYFL